MKGRQKTRLTGRRRIGTEKSGPADELAFQSRNPRLQKSESREQARLREARTDGVPWHKWGPYLSERQWGTVREDCGSNGDAWNYFTHDHARSRAYRWGEDGIAGFCDDEMRLCFALGLWNGKDPIIKERLFGLTPSEGNHGEDVKECYFYLDATPTNSYAKMLYKYPQAAFPYQDLVQTNKARSQAEPEYELIDTGVFDGDRYFDVFVEYAKASPEDILIRISIINRGPDPGILYVLPHLWFRNTWWQRTGGPVPQLMAMPDAEDGPVIVADHCELGRRYLRGEISTNVLFTNNETNVERLFGMSNPNPYVKDGINNFIVQGRRDAVNLERTGTKAALAYRLSLAPGVCRTVRLRLNQDATGKGFLGPSFEKIFSERQREANEFYAEIIPRSAGAEKSQMMREGFAGMLWSKQVYIYDVNRWLKDQSLTTNTDGPVRNSHWFHLDSHEIVSVPDKWEYPWFSAWDSAFQTVPLALLDPDYAQQQFSLMLREGYQHPNGQLPGCENNFDEVNPPMHAWAALFNYRLTKHTGDGRALELLKGAFHKLLLNFAWWVNRKDVRGRNVFEGGFLDVDNISMLDRNIPLPSGGCLELADGTAWMVFFAQNMLAISLELALHDPVYEDMAIRFYEHFILIASAMGRLGDAADSMWDEADGFFYNVLRLPDGSTRRLKVRSTVGLLPLCAVVVYPEEVVRRLPRYLARVQWFEQNRPNLVACVSPPQSQGVNGRYMLAILDEVRLRRVLTRLLDPNEFLGDYGIRSLSRSHLQQPCIVEIGGKEYRVGYSPGESDSEPSNGNWRGPIWLPENALLLRALIHMYTFYGNAFTVECPTGSGKWMNLFEVAKELAGRLGKIFLRGKDGRRPVFGHDSRFQTDPHWPDHILFYEYFDGDTGAGHGASHQTGWTGLAPAFVYLFEKLDAERVLKEGLASFVSVIGELHAPKTPRRRQRPLIPKKPPLYRAAHRKRRVPPAVKRGQRTQSKNL
ncbi:MAG TPA: glucosidase [Verrucomicrobiae bacterium]|jgi:hypothetical protein|nr:glucosidase [Verrucomicrobiae bacterium]